MLRLLISDDDDNKSAKIRQIADEVLSFHGLTVECAGNATDTIAALRKGQFDVLILDLNQPVRKNAPAKKDAGLGILREIASQKRGISTPKAIIGISTYSDLITEQEDEFKKRLWSLIRYDSQTSTWSEQLASFLLHLASADSDVGAYKTDLAIVTALSKIELEAVLELPAGWKTEESPADDTVYYRGEFGDSTLMSVVAASALTMGIAASTALAAKIIYEYRPRTLCMAGIAAGADKKFSFGDVLVATSAYDYGSGKVSVTKRGKSIFKPAPEQLPCDPWIASRIEMLRMSSKISERLMDGWQGEKPKKLPVLRPGPFASGAAVVSDRSLIDQIIAKNRKVVGVEMEVYGVMMASRIVRGPRPKVFAMKSVCDFGGATKNDKYQAFAAHTSARATYEFAINYLLPRAGMHSL